MATDNSTGETYEATLDNHAADTMKLTVAYNVGHLDGQSKEMLAGILDTFRNAERDGGVTISLKDYEWSSLYGLLFTSQLSDHGTADGVNNHDLEGAMEEIEEKADDDVVELIEETEQMYDALINAADSTQ